MADNKSVGWLRRERLTTSRIDTDPKTYKKLLPKKTTKSGKWMQNRSWKNESSTMAHTFKNNWINRNITGPDYIDKQTGPLRRSSKKNSLLGAALSILPLNPVTVFPPSGARARRFADRYGMSKAAARYGEAIDASSKRGRDIKRAEKNIADRYGS